MSVGSAPRILFLYADVGGGHRSATEAMVDALESEHAGYIQVAKVDFLRDCYPWPYTSLPSVYREMVKFPRLYRTLWYGTDGPRRVRLLMALNRVGNALGRRFDRLLVDHGPDLLVLTHFMAIPPTTWIPRERRPHTAVVVTDLVTTHASWFSRIIDDYVVPTAAAFEKAVQHGVAPKRIHLTGLPVSERFANWPVDRRALRRLYGWPEERPLVLLIGGGEGMGPLYENAVAIANCGLDLSLVVIAGRNAGLQSRLEAMDWPVPVFVYGFVTEMHEFMHAADVLVTKAGPSTLCEGLNSGRPIVMYSRLPGQEEGNVDYLVQAGAGIFAPAPAEVVSALRTLLSDTTALARAENAARRLARPEAAHQTACLLADWAKKAATARHIGYVADRRTRVLAI